MKGLPYIPGLPADWSGPLTRFLPPLESGTVATWLSKHVQPASWLLDPFGFSPRLPVEAARAGYRVLVTVNNPVTRFLLEMEAKPPAEIDFKAALAGLAASRKGDEHLETHLQSLYLTRCEQCGREIQAEAYLWRRMEDVPFARIYECRDCGDKGERAATPEDIDRARKIAATDALHRSRALERVSARDDEDRNHVQEAIQHYLPRPLYVLTTIVNRLDSLDLSPERKRALTALVLAACDAGNKLWDHPAARPHPKQLSIHGQFREQNLWLILERGLDLWRQEGEDVQCVDWPNKIPGTAGICIFEGRLKGLADEVKKEIPIAAAIGSIPRPNQAFWTLSALWSGWIWGRAAVEPYKIALRRRRYDWVWNATALHSAFTHLSGLLALGTQFLGLLPEAEPSFLSSAFTAISASGFDLKGLALRTAEDPVQSVWERGEHLRREIKKPVAETLRQTIEEYLADRGEPASYLHVHGAALEVMAQSHALRPGEQDLDVALRGTQSVIETALIQGKRFIHYSSGDAVEAGAWGLEEWSGSESLADRVELTIVNHLQKRPQTTYQEIESEVNQALPGLWTPSRGLIDAVLNSYGSRDGTSWRLRPEDKTAMRLADLKAIGASLEAIGQRLNYNTLWKDKWLTWQEGGNTVRAFTVLASALVRRAITTNPHPREQSILVVPGGRGRLIAYKAQHDPMLVEHLKDYRLTAYRLWRALSQAPILTRETFEEQLSSDPIELAQGQMILF